MKYLLASAALILAGAYTYLPGGEQFALRINSNQGFNSSTTRNGPTRSGASGVRSKVSHYGNGDGVAFNAEVFVAGRKAGARSWLASPAGVLYNGSAKAGADGAYLNGVELHFKDAGHDIATTGIVLNFSRTNDRGRLGAGWDGIRLQSQGTRALNSGFRLDGRYDVGINLSRAQAPAAIALRRGQRVYLDAKPRGDFGTDLGRTYIFFDGKSIRFVVNGKQVLEVPD
jgi:hypothetical protein